MTFDEFVSKWNGKEADWDGAYAGQCVDLFRYYCNEVLNIPQPDGVWGAANFWTDYDTDEVLKAHFDKIPNSPTFTPQKGDVMVWDFDAGGGFGHIGMCTGENTGTQNFKSFDQNWITLSVCEIVNHTYKNVYGVLRPKGGDMATVEELQKQIEELKLAHKIEIDDKNKNIESYDKQVKDLLQKIKDLEANPPTSTPTEWQEVEKTDEYVKDDHKIIVKSKKGA